MASSSSHLKQGTDGHPVLLEPLKPDRGLCLCPLPDAIPLLSFQAWCPGAASLHRIL